MTTRPALTKTHLAVAAALAVVAAGSTAPVLAKSHSAKLVACYGVNSCKGTSDCKTAHNECKGMNSCKGQGFKDMTKAACIKADGSLTPKA